MPAQLRSAPGLTGHAPFGGEEADVLDEEDQSLSLAISQGDPSSARLQVDVGVGTDLGIEIVAMVTRHLSERTKGQG